MFLNVGNFIKIMEEIAPVKLKQDYDNVGLMVSNTCSEVSSILVALDCTLEVIKEAKNKSCSLIISHHPLLFKKPESINYNTLLGRKVIELIKNDISLYSSHTNLDIVSGGLNDILVQILGFQNAEVMDTFENNDRDYNTSGIGRLVTLMEPITLLELCDRVKNTLNIQYLRYSGCEEQLIKRLAVINGSGQDYFKMAKDKGADCIITGDTSYHYVSDFSEESLSVIDAGHFATEWPSMKVFASKLQSKLIQAGFKNVVTISSKTEDPYKYR